MFISLFRRLAGRTDPTDRPTGCTCTQQLHCDHTRVTIHPTDGGPVALCDQCGACLPIAEVRP